MKLWPRMKLEHPPDETLITNPTPDDLEYRRRAYAWIQNGCRGPGPTRPWTDQAEVRGWGDEHGIESVYAAPEPEPVPPEDAPLSGVFCRRCWGSRDPRCCQHANFAYINSIRESQT